MDHRPFESWLLDNKALSAEDRQRLKAHLQACASCTALAEVDLALKSSRLRAPAAGFVSRFQVRLEARKTALRRRNAWGFFILTVSVLGLVAWLSWPVLAAAVRSPLDVLGSWLSTLVTAWATFRAMFEAGSVFFKVIPSFVPTFVLPVLLIAAAGWSLVWICSLMKFTKFKQGA